MRLACPIAFLLCVGAAGGGGGVPPIRRSRPAPAQDHPGKIVGPVTVTPATVSFNGPDPDLPLVPGTPGAQVAWRGNGNDGGPNWTVWVEAASGSFDLCPTVPASAVTVSCQSAQGGGGALAACSPAFTLSSSPRAVATGTQVKGANLYSVSLTFTLNDSWRHAAAPQCTLNLTYTIDFP